MGETGCGKERKGGLSEEKVEIVKTCIQKKKSRKSETFMYERGKGNIEALVVEPF